MRRAPVVACTGPTKAWTILAIAGAIVALATSCSATTRYKVLSTIFDGVPPPAPETAPAEPGAPAAAAPTRLTGARDHGPYAARLCNACHEAAATNALIVPRDQLCFQCHELRIDKKYVHGPIASGGCLVCHDPHGSRYRYLLVSESDSFCFHCHDQAAVAAIAGHEALENGCTDCHDAHASDQKYLLK